MNLNIIAQFHKVSTKRRNPNSAKAPHSHRMCEAVSVTIWHPHKQGCQFNPVWRDSHLSDSFLLTGLSLFLFGINWVLKTQWPSTETLLLLFMSFGRVHISELQPLADLFFITQMMYECGMPLWNDTGRGNREVRWKPCPSATSSTRNHTWTDPGLRSDRPAANRSSRELRKNALYMYLSWDGPPVTLVLMIS
jgi:hypothetical protein